MKRLARIGAVKCLACGFFGDHYINYENPATQLCPDCGNSLIESNRRNTGVLPGGFSDDPSSDLFVRPDKDHPAREMFLTWKKIEDMEREGKTPKINDHAQVKRHIEYYEKRYGEI